MKRRWIPTQSFILFLALATFFSGCLGGSPAVQTYSLEVSVINRDTSQPLAGATVEVVGKITETKTANAAGVVSFRGLRGTIDILVNLTGFIPSQTSLTLVEDKNVEILLKPEAEPASVANLEDFDEALADLEIAAIVLASDLEVPEGDSLIIQRPVDLDLDGKTITGDLEFDFADSATINLSGEGEIFGNLLIKAAQATVTNRIKVNQTIVIEELASSTWHEYCDDNRLQVTGSNISVHLHTGTHSIISAGPDNNIIIEGGSVYYLEARAPVTVSGADRIMYATVSSPGVVFDKEPSNIGGDYDPDIIEPNEDPGVITLGKLKGDIYHIGTEDPVMESIVIVLDDEIEIDGYNGGYFRLNLAPGSYQLHVESDLFEEYTAVITIKDGQETTHDIGLQRIDVPPGQTNIDLVHVPGAQSFPMGASGEACTDVSYSYQLGKYQVTYDLWEKVYDWATHNYRGDNRYLFKNLGQIGHSATGDKQNPVVYINWREAIVWCNALTEYYNIAYANDLTCVYTYNGEIIRDATDDQACDHAVAQNATGFRLPTSAEWELAARYQDGHSWTSGFNASGDTTGTVSSGFLGTISEVFGDYGWHLGNSDGWTHPVGEKLPNHLGIYDMSGNVFEFCFDLFYPDVTSRVTRGGAYNYDSSSLAVSTRGQQEPDEERDYTGFRIAKSY